MTASSLFGVLILDRNPFDFGNLLGLIQAWLQDAGGFAAVGLGIYLLYALTSGDQSESAKTRLSVSGFMLVMFVAAVICYALYFTLVLTNKGVDPHEPQVHMEAGGTYKYVPPHFSFGQFPPPLQPLFLSLGGLFAILGIGQPFARDLLKLRGRRIWALATLGFKEAVRSRIFWVFLIFLLPWLFPAKWFIQIKAEDELRTMVAVSAFWSHVLLLVPAGLLAALSIPNDIKSQNLYTVVTKPVEKFEIVLGRFLGYTLLMTGALAVMTAAGAILISATTIDEKAKEETFRARMPLRGTLEFRSRKGDFEGTNVGREFEYRKYIAGDPQSSQRGVWSFQNAPQPAGGQTYAVCEFTFDIFRLTKGEENRGVDVSVRVVTWKCPQAPPVEGGAGVWRWADPARQKEYEDERARIEAEREEAARRAGRPYLPLAAARPEDADAWAVVNQLAEKYGVYEVSGKEVYDYHPASVPIPVGLFANARDGSPPAGQPRLQVFVKCESRSQMLGMAEGDLYLLVGERTFFENYFKGAVGLWCRITLVIGVAISLSTYLAGILAWLTTKFLYVSAYFTEHLMDVAARTSTGGGPFESMTRLLRTDSPTTPLDESGTVKTVQGLDSVFAWVVRRFVNLVPDVEAFSWNAFVQEGFNVGFEYIVLNLVCLVGYLLPWGVLAYYLMRSREVAGS